MSSLQYLLEEELVLIWGATQVSEHMNQIIYLPASY